MLSQLLAIAKNTFQESARQPIYAALVLAGGLLQIMNTAMSGYTFGHLADSGEVQADNEMLLGTGLATVLGLSTLLAACTATSVIGREIRDQTALTVVSKPVSRTTFVLGKYLGAAAAVGLATLALLLQFRLVLSHGVVSATHTPLDSPVLFFGFGSLLLAAGTAAWCNFFYGWAFPSTCVFLLTPLLAAAWLLTLPFSHDWTPSESLLAEFQPQVGYASLAVLPAMLVLTAVAVAASTRLSQVLTLCVCCGAFLLGLLSNHLLGRYAFVNTPVGRVTSAEPSLDRDSDFLDAGDVWRVTLHAPPARPIKAGSPLYYGASPNGAGLSTPAYEPLALDLSDAGSLFSASPPALVVTSAGVAGPGGTGFVFTLGNAGGLAVSRPPAEGDTLFLSPTKVNPFAAIAWSVVPNLQFFWLCDAVTQNHPIPVVYMVFLVAYTLAQVGALLGVAVALFQTRDVG